MLFTSPAPLRLEGNLQDISQMQVWSCELRQAFDFKENQADEDASPPRARALSVHLGRISEDTGLGAGELQILSAAMHELKRLKECEKRPLSFITIGDAILDRPEAEARKLIQDLLYWISDLQADADLPRFTLLVREFRPALHGHFVAVLGKDGRERLAASKKFAPYFADPEAAIQRVWKIEGLTIYLAGERRPNVKGGAAFGSRVKGAHRNGEGGGDRLTPSPAFKRHLIERGLIQDYRRTNADLRGLYA